MAREFRYPQELIIAICAFVYSSGLPAPAPSLDPLVLTNENGIPTALPSSSPPGSWSEPVARLTLANLCLVNHAWYAGAKPWLWRKIEVRLPRTWLSIADEVVGRADDEANTEKTLGVSIKAAADAALASSPVGSPVCTSAFIELEERMAERLNAPGSPVPPELLSPPASRDPSPTRVRDEDESASRWHITRATRDAVKNVVQDNESGVYVPGPHDPRPGRYVRQLDFNHFRTIGMFRSIGEGNNSRFVTGDRIEAVLKEMTNLTAFGATEYMDGALTLTVLRELFLRGAPSQRYLPRGRGLTHPGDQGADEADRVRFSECNDLEAVDFTGCVSAAFVNALTEFVTAHLLPGEERPRKSRRTRFLRVVKEEPLTIPGLHRLGLRGVKSIPPHILNPFVLAFPSLTHLDLSGTRANPELLSALGQSLTLRLRSLSLARCVALTGDSIRDFLISSPVSSRIQELSLYGDMTYSSPLSADDLRDILTNAPCFTSGQLVYLDVSSSPFTADLVNVFKPQPKLRSLGLSYIPRLPLGAVADFLLCKAPNIEVLTLVSTSPELDCGLRAGGLPGAVRSQARQASLELHAQLIMPLCTAPFSFSVFPTAPAVPPLTRVRVIELCTPMLAGLGTGASSWRVVRSKGGRGWYVDTSSGWVADGKEGSVLRRDLEKTHVLRTELDRLADANGNVTSGIGWHARKMEILHGHGMLGREDGLYGAVSFAHQG